jgi:protein-disulfide isomerase
MTTNTKISLSVLAVIAVVVGALVMLARPEGVGGASSTAPASVLVRPDSHQLSTAADGRVTVVEFLDLECGSCGAAFPGVERLRGEYAGKVTFVMRYFPLRSHRNAELAARAVEAAGQQGQLEPMYRKMFETQPQWAGAQVSQRAAFLGFARDLGLDMAKFEAALDDQATIDRVLADRADGISLGVTGTPTFFINGVKFTGTPTYQALKSAIDGELANEHYQR